MAKKSARRASRGNHKAAKLSPEAREQKARQDLSLGHFRDAIAGFKELLKLEPRPDWKSALADAYAGRAQELTAKDMLKEALVMWDNRTGLGLGGAIHPNHAALLMRTGGVDRVLALFADDKQLPAAGREQLRPLLAARVIAGDANILSVLAEDDPVRRHADAACAALDAYCTSDNQALQTALAALPFRSPYRDWVTILKALQQASDQPRQASAQLARIGDDSAFAALRRAGEMALLPEAAFVDAITGAQEATLRFACALRGWPPERLRLQSELARIDTDQSPRLLLRLMFRYQTKLGADWVRRQALRLLWKGFPDSLDWIALEGANELTREEYFLIRAWSAAESYDPWKIFQCWSMLADQLMRSTVPNGDTELHRLRIATALRATELQTNLLSETEPSDDPDDLHPLVAQQLERSLEYDPDDRDTHLQLIDYYRRGKRLKDARRLLTQASDQWPKDMQIFQAAFTIALDAGAFKKAAGIARQMLEIDPINTAVRERLVDAHLSHAHKQLKRLRPNLAHKEISSAKDWARGSQMQERVDLTAGLITLNKDMAAGATALHQRLTEIGGGLAGRVALALAADNFDLTQNQLQRRAKLAKAASLGPKDIQAALGRLRAHVDRGGGKSRDLTAWLDRTFSAVAWKELDQNDLEAACDTLRRVELHQARLHAASAALKRWKGMPVFELHAFEARYPDGFDGYSDEPLFRLKQAIERAQAEGDDRTASRIKNALQSALSFGGTLPIGFPSPPPVFLGDPFGDDFEDDFDSAPNSLQDIAEMINALGIEKALEMLGLPPKLLKELKQAKREMGEEALVESLIGFLSGDAGLDDLTSPPMPMPKPKPKPKPKSPRQRSAQPRQDKPQSTAPKTDSNADPEDEDPNQLKLF